ncbi:MAG: glycosyltransferase family 39 protein, partial [Thermomicrobium sp.]
PQTVRQKKRGLAALQAAGFVTVIVLALTLRLHGINWDQWHLLHPDERFQLVVAVDRIHTPHALSELLDPSQSPWNPRSAGADGRPQAFAYGALPLYVLEATSWLVDRIRSLLGLLSPGSLDPYRTLAFRGRLASALVDLIGILFAMAIARRAFGTGAALTTGALLAMSVIAIQQAHFFVVDPWASTLSTITLWAAIQLARTGTRGWGIATGVAYAAALACKASMWPLAVPIAVALIWSAAQHVPKPWRMGTLFRAVLVGAPWSIVAVATITAFAVLEPYTVLDPRSTLQDILREWQIARGELDVPYTRQYVDTVPIVYHIVQLWRWGLGPAFATFAIFIVVKEVISIGKVFRARSSVQVAIAGSPPTCSPHGLQRRSTCAIPYPLWGRWPFL